MELWDRIHRNMAKISGHEWQSRCTETASNMDRINGHRTWLASCRSLENKIGSCNAVHPEVQNTNWTNWGSRVDTNGVGPWRILSYLESVWGIACRHQLCGALTHTIISGICCSDWLGKQRGSFIWRTPLKNTNGAAAGGSRQWQLQIWLEHRQNYTYYRVL